MNIGQAAAASGVSAKMVRHYEQIGLLAPATRTDAGYRQYRAADIEVLSFIRRARLLGFSIEQIRELLSLRSNRGRSSRRVKAVAQGHLDELEEKLRDLLAMKAALERLITACAGDDGPACGILDGLAGGEATGPDRHPDGPARSLPRHRPEPPSPGRRHRRLRPPRR